MDGLTFLADAPTLQPADEGAIASSWCQVAKKGKFKHPLYGNFTIDDSVFDSFIRNLGEVSGGEVPFDFDHDPDKGGPTEACGWIKQLERRAGGTELWAYVEWLDAGAEAIREQRYKYTSPTWKLNYTSDDGTKRGPTLLATALTNRPWFERMAVVNLSQSFSAPTFAELDGTVEEEPDTTKADPSDSRPAMEFSATFSTSIASALGLSGEVTEEQILTASRELAAKAEKAPKEGELVMTASEVLELKDGAAAGKEAQKTLHEQRFETAFSKAVDAHFIAPAEKESYAALYEANADATISAIEARQTKLVPDKAAGAGPGTQTAGAPDGVDEERFELTQRAQAYAAEHKVDFVTAVEAIQREERE